MNIFVLRHGEAGTRTTVPSKDFERPLTEAGRNEIERIAQSLSDLKVEFDLIATSPLRRAKETADIVARVYGEKKKPTRLEVWNELKPESNRQELVAKLSKMRQDEDLLLVGHEPFLSNFIGEIIAGTPSARIVLKKGGIAKVQIVSFVPKVTGELRWLITPKHMRKM